MKCFILHLPLFIFFLAGSARAGTEAMCWTASSGCLKCRNGLCAVGEKSREQSGYLFIYDSKVIHNDSVVRVRKQECSV